MPDMTDLIHIAPFVALAAGALLVIAVDLIVPEQLARPWAYGTSVVAVLLTGWYLLQLWATVQAEGALAPFLGTVLADRLSLVLSTLLVIVALFIVVMSAANRARDMAGYLALVLFSVLGMMVLGAAGDLMVLFVSLEVFSLALYALIAFQRHRVTAREGAFKYFLLGSVASGFLLYGFALIYGSTGALSLADIGAYVQAGTMAPLFQAGFGMALVGFAFKIALVPFHFWAPDAYEAASSPITALMAVGTKAAALVAMIRFLWATVPLEPEMMERYMLPVAILAIISMLGGSLGALFQTNLKRLLAFSGVTNAGFLLMPLITLESRGLTLTMFYIFAYMFMTLGAFTVMSGLHARGETGTELTGLAGLGRRQPWLAGAMAFFFLAFAGTPPTGGFTGKLLIIGGALQAGGGALVAAFVVSTTISAFVYLRVVLTMYRRGDDPAEQRAPGVAFAAAGAGYVPNGAPARGEISAGTDNPDSSAANASADAETKPAADGRDMTAPSPTDTSLFVEDTEEVDEARPVEATAPAEIGRWDETAPWAAAWTHVGIGALVVLAIAGTLAVGMFPEPLLNMLEGLLPVR